MKEKIGCIILAAGHGKRFGAQNKLTCTLGGRPLMQWALDAIPREIFADVCVVVTNDDVAEICASAGFSCARYEGGQLSDSVRCGLRHLPEDLDGYMFVNADRPFLQSETICRMLRLFEEAPDFVVRLYWRDMPSNPILFPRTAREELLRLSGDRGGSAVLKSGRYAVRPVYAETETETWDIDSPEALEEARKLLS